MDRLNLRLVAAVEAAARHDAQLDKQIEELLVKREQVRWSGCSYLAVSCASGQQTLLRSSRCCSAAHTVYRSHVQRVCMSCCPGHCGF